MLAARHRAVWRLSLFLCVTARTADPPPQASPARSASCLIGKLEAQLCILKSSELRGFVNSGPGAQVLIFVLSPNSSPTSSPAHIGILLVRQLGTGLRPRLPDVLHSPPLWAQDRPSVELGFLISPFFSGPPLQDCAPVWALRRTRPFSVWGLFRRANSLPPPLRSPVF